MATFKIFRVCTTGPYFDLFQKFVSAHAGASFDASMQACRESGFLYPADFKRAIEAEGAEAMEVIVDMADLQKKWLVEDGGKAESHEAMSTFFRQLDSFKPDVVHFQTFFALPHDIRKQIKARCPSVKLITGHRGFPNMNCAGYEDVDAVFLGYPRHHEPWHAVGVKTFHHNHAFDAGLLPKVEAGLALLPRHDFTFVGTTGWGFGPHDGRYYDMLKILSRTNLEIWGNEPDSVQSATRSQLRDRALDVLQHMPVLSLKALHKLGQHSHPVFMRAANAALQRKAEARTPAKPVAQDVPTASATTSEYWYLKEKPIRELYPRRMHPAVFGLDYLRLLATSRISWNRQLEMDGAGANMRLFEACGVGSCQISDVRPEVVECYKPDEEIVTYTSIEECVDKVRYLLKNDTERLKIAAAGQARTLREHTTAHRVREMHTKILELLG
jgi:spore maturation protein CgeB